MLTMLPNKVAIEPIFDADTIGSIIVPDQAKGRCDQGIVKYVGNECKVVQVGDHVLFSGYTGTLMEVEDEGLLIIMSEEFITAITYEDPIELSGIYFKDREGNYFNATHEMALTIIAREMKGHVSVRTSKNAIAHSPTYGDYERGR